ncbi:50S ribosomal protein L15 [Candidatus Saccharibacteria bacterium]|nr:50S ribosomal protein L15 [Candidatus Saccharibacteria bacterium]
MKFNELTASANKDRKRVGRGISAGGGKTAGRGTKGQGSRTGKKLNATFMGGQGALVQRIPKKRGFRSLRTPAQVVYLGSLELFEGKTVTNDTLFEQGFIATPYHAVKIITKGELKKALDVKVSGASASAIAAIEKAGGSFEKSVVPVKQKTETEAA